MTKHNVRQLVTEDNWRASPPPPRFILHPMYNLYMYMCNLYTREIVIKHLFSERRQQPTGS